mgnify:CR=1 FL=1
MEEQFLRTAMLLGENGVRRLQNARVAVFGLGGVGGYVVEALCRAGIGALDLIDKDDVSLSNLNRQILATHATVGMLKTQAAARRIAEINPRCVVREYPVFYLPEYKKTMAELSFAEQVNCNQRTKAIKKMAKMLKEKQKGNLK